MNPADRNAIAGATRGSNTWKGTTPRNPVTALRRERATCDLACRTATTTSTPTPAGDDPIEFQPPNPAAARR